MQYKKNTATMDEPLFSNFNFSNAAIDSVINTAKEVILVCDKDEKIQFVNPAFEKLTGYKLKEVIGKTPRILSSGKHSVQFYKSFWKSLITQKKVSAQLCNKKKNGDLYWVNMTIVAVVDENGNIKNYIANCIDITQQKSIEENFDKQTNKNKLLLAQQVSEVIFIEWDIKNQCLKPTDKLYEFLGLTPDDKTIFPHAFEEMIYFNDINKVKNEISLALKNKKPFHLDFRIIHKSGRVIWLSALVDLVKNQYDGTEYWLGTLRDITQQKKDNQKIQQSTKILSEIKSIVLVMDAVGDIIFVSPSIKKLGYTQKETLGEGWWNLTYDNKSVMKRSKEAFIHSINSNSEIDLNNYNRKVLCKDGSIKWLNFQISTGTEGTLIGIAHDVTEQLKAQKELEESEKRLALTLDVIGFGGWDWNIVTDTVKYTDNWLVKTGYTKDEARKNKLLWKDIIHPDDLQRVLEKTDYFIKGDTKNKVHFNEYRLLYKSGEYKMNLDRGMVVEWDENGNPARMVGIDTDLSERKLAEDKIYQLSQIIEKNPIPMVITDNEGKVEYVNSTYEKYTGRSLKSILGKTIKLLRFKDENKKCKNKVWNAVSKGKIWKGEVRVINKKGKELCELATLSPIINNNGEITSFLSVREDITERKHLEENFLKAIIEAQEDEKHRLGEELHDGLGQMLGAVNLYIEVLIKNREKSASFQLEVLNKVKQLNEAASIEYRAISHGLMFRKLIEDGLLLALKDICDNFKETTSIEFTFLKKGVKEEDFSDHVKLNIYRIVQEITTNIVKHSKAMHAIIKLATNKKKEIILSVTDDGIGIDKNKKKTFGSKGLGLKNIQQRTEIMGGTVKVISNAGEGTIFKIKIPNPLL